MPAPGSSAEGRSEWASTGTVSVCLWNKGRSDFRSHFSAFLKIPAFLCLLTPRCPEPPRAPGLLNLYDVGGIAVLGLWVDSEGGHRLLGVSTERALAD